VNPYNLRISGVSVLLSQKTGEWFKAVLKRGREMTEVQFLRKATKGLAEGAAGTSAPRLSAEAKEQMRQSLEEALKNSASSSS